MAYNASIEWAMIANIEKPATTSGLFCPSVFTISPNGIDEGIEFGAIHAENTRYNPYATGIAIKEKNIECIMNNTRLTYEIFTEKLIHEISNNSKS